MGYLRTKTIKGAPYLYEQESYRKDGDVHTRHVRYVGGGKARSRNDAPLPTPHRDKTLSPERQERINNVTTAKRRLWAALGEKKYEVKAYQKLFDREIDTYHAHYNKKTGQWMPKRAEKHEQILEALDNPNAVVRKPVPTNEELRAAGVTDENYKQFLKRDPAKGEISVAEYVAARQIQTYKEKGDIISAKEATNWWNHAQKPTVIFLGGPPGSGKSQVILKGIDTDKFITIDSDAIKERLPEYNGLNASLVHEESGVIADRAVDHFAALGRNIIIDGTLKSTEKAKKKMQWFRDAGYDVKLYATNISEKSSVERATSRAISKGRYVPVEFIAENVEKINKSVRNLAPYADEYKIYDNDVPKGAPPKVVMQGTNEFSQTAK